MHSLNIFLVLVLVTVQCSAESDNCDKYGILLYEDIACKAVKNETQDCPSRYECNISQPNSGCLFKGKIIGPGEVIDSNLTYSACTIGCICDDEDSTILCPVLDCPEDFGWSTIIDQTCYYGYELGQCCSTGQICNNTADSKTCLVDGMIYKLGQRFYPKNACLSCVCHEDFNGEYDEKTCIRQNCISQIYYADELSKNCAPAYFKRGSGDAICCPNTFVCPDSKDEIKVINDDAEQEAGMECSYGEKTLKLGEGFNRRINKYGQDIDVKCECVIPPLVTCKET